MCPDRSRRRARWRSLPPRLSPRSASVCNTKKKYNRTLRSTIYALLVVAALAVLVATIFLPVLAHELSE